MIEGYLMALLPSNDYQRFILAGNATFTAKSQRTGQRFTYKVKQADKREESETPLYFVSVLNGPDNWTNYQFFGTIKESTIGKTFSFSSRSAKVGEDTPSVKGFKWLWKNVEQLPDFMEIWHEGKCGRCGRKLTVPESIASGFGPECIGKV